MKEYLTPEGTEGHGGRGRGKYFPKNSVVLRESPWLFFLKEKINHGRLTCLKE
jgi:hypothetical protein